MANTLNGVNVAEIAQRSFASFKSALAPLNAFSTSFDSEARQKNESVTTRIITGVSGSAFSSYETGDTVLTAKTVTLNQHSVAPLHLTDVQAGKTPVDVVALQAVESAYGVGAAVVDYVLGLFLAATYGDVADTSKKVVATASFDADDVADLALMLDTNGVPEMGRALILSNAGINSLRKDNALQDASALGSNEVIREGSIGRLLGFDVYRSALPSAITDENTYGLATHPSCMAVAARPVVPQTNDIDFELVTDPESGLSLGYRMHYKRSDGSLWHTAECLYGATAAQTTGAVRLVSA